MELKTDYFHGSVSLTATKVVPQTAKNAEEVLQHLAAQYGVEIEVNLDIRAKLPSGFDSGTIRAVTENCVALKFDQGSGFEQLKE